MSTLILEVYDALKSAGAPEDKAQAAATVLADTVIARAKINALATKSDLSEIKSDVTGIKRIWDSW